MIDTKAIFEEAHTHNGWQDKPVPDDLLRRVYDLAEFGPTCANSCPMRVVFVKSAEAKARLKPSLNEGNVEKTMKAPATAIIAYDTEFYELLPRLSPQRDFRSVYAEFFPDGRWKSNFLCNLGYGDPAKVRPRNPRPSFEEACRVL